MYRVFELFDRKSLALRDFAEEAEALDWTQRVSDAHNISMRVDEVDASGREVRVVARYCLGMQIAHYAAPASQDQQSA